MIKVIVAGSRDFTDEEYVASHLNHRFWNISANEIILLSGCARGVDKLGEAWAKSRGIKIEPYPADWDRYGKALAGKVRNVEMAKNATHCICFWNGESRGTEHMIGRAKARKLILTVYEVST